MSQFINDFRTKNPQYNDLADDQLVSALHNKFYSDIPIEQFNQKIGYQSSQALPIASKTLPNQQSLPQSQPENLPTSQPAQPKPLSFEPVVGSGSYDTSSIDGTMKQLIDSGYTKDEILNKYDSMGMADNVTRGKIESALSNVVAPQQQPIEQAAPEKPAKEQSMLELIAFKAKNIAAGAGERAGDLGGALLDTIQVLGSGLEEKLPMGGLVWEEGDVLPSYQSAKQFEKTNANPLLGQASKAAKDLSLGYKEQVNWKNVKDAFSGSGALSASAYGNVIEYGLEQGFKSIPDMGAALFALPTYIFARSGEIGAERAKNKGKAETEVTDILEAAPFAVASSLLERIGAKGITQAGKEELGQEILKAGLAASAKRVGSATGKAVGKEALTEAAQEGMIEYVGERFGTNAAMSWKEALDQAAAGAVAGGVMGGAGGAAVATGNELAYSPEKTLAQAMEQDIDRANIEGTGPELKAYTERAAPQTKQPLMFEIEERPAAKQKALPEFDEGVQMSEAIQGPAPKEDQPAKQQVTGLAVVEAPIEELTISKDVPQFKEGANIKGVVEPLGGKFERTGVSPIQIWVRSNGDKEVISGRHRLDLAQRSGEQTIPAQYHYEDQGFDSKQAAALDAVLNIREGQGKVKDYVDFIQSTELTKDQAIDQGILARQTGKRAFTIATDGTDALIIAHRNDKLTDEAASRIAIAAPGSEKLQSVGIKAIQDGKTIAVAENMVKAVKYMADESGQGGGDLFGFDDSAMIEAENLAKKAAKKQSEIQRTLSAVQGAAKRPDLAAKEGVDVKNPDAVKARMEDLKNQKREWQNWHTNTNLVNELKGDDFALTQETESQRQAREAQEATAQKERTRNQAQEESKAKADKDVGEFVLTGSDRNADVQAAGGQGDLLSSTDNAGSVATKEKTKWDFLKEKIKNKKEISSDKKGEISFKVYDSFDDKQMYAFDKNGDIVGELFFGFLDGKLVGSVEVKETERRKGIATSMYDLASKIEGVEITPSENNSKDAKAFWENRSKKESDQNNFDGVYIDNIAQNANRTVVTGQYSGVNFRASYDKNGNLDKLHLTAQGLNAYSEMPYDEGTFSQGSKPIISSIDKLTPSNGKGLTDAGLITPSTDVIGGNEATERNITSSTYERSKKRTEKSAEGFVSGSGLGGNILVKYEYADQPLAAFDQFRSTVRTGRATAESIKNDLDNLVKNKDAVIAKLNERSFTKAVLQQMIRSPRTDLKKSAMVRLAYQNMMSEHVMGQVTVTVLGGADTFDQQIQDQVAKQTQADVDAAYEKQRQMREDMEKRKEEFVKALSNPETLPDFKEFIRVRGKDKMTTQQLARYDELVAETMRDQKPAPETIKGETETVDTEMAQTTHTKTGADLFVVKMLGRVDKDKFRELSAKAKKMGGYHSSYSKGGAIPGFQFKTQGEANTFNDLLSGKDIQKSDFQEAKADMQHAKNADRLLDMAQKMEDRATEEINRPRQANTARRASMASGATEKAEKQLALAKTVREIANKIQDGDIVHLGQLSQVTQLEELISIQNRAIPQSMYADSRFDVYSINRQLKDGVTVNDYIGSVDYPQLEMQEGHIKKIIEGLSGKKGFTRLAAELKKLPSGRREDIKIINKDQADKIIAAEKQGLISSFTLGFLPDRMTTIARLNKVGITTGEQLRAAIRELDSLKVEQRKEDPVKAMERKLVGQKIEGFFPTPKTLVEGMIDYADIKAGHEVLEPSAGKGNIAQEIKASAPDASLDVVEFNAGLSDLLKAKGFNVVGSDFLEYGKDGKKQYDRIVMNPPFKNFQDIDHVQHAYSLLKPGGKLVAIMGAGVKNSRKKAVEFREWLDDMGSYIEDLPEGSFKGSERSTGVNTVMVTLQKNDSKTLNYKSQDNKVSKAVKKGDRVFNAPGHNFIGMFKSSGIPERKNSVTIEGRTVRMPDAPQRIEPIMNKLISMTGRRIYFGKIKGKSNEGFYRPKVGEIRTRRKNDVEVLAHEMAHYLDMYSNQKIPNFLKVYSDPRYREEVDALSYTDADPEIQTIEGFAEFVRLWLTNSNEAQARAPKFYQAFNEKLATDKRLQKPMRDLQELMHKFYFQGPDKLGQALIGNNPAFSQRFNEWSYRRDSRIRQQTIDKFHAARKVEQELTGKIGDVQDSAWKQLRLANGGAEGISDYILNYGTVQFDENGDLQRSGKSLHEVLEPVKTIKLKPEDKGTQKIDLLMRYFAGRRALELHRQGRENLIPKETAKTWARLGTKYPVFDSIHQEYQDFNGRMMDFYEESGMVTPEGRKAMESMNRDYVPFNRVRDQLAGGKGASSGGFQRLRGGTANLNDILVNIQDGVQANVRVALNNRAKQRLYGYISNHKDGAIFATRIAPDSKPVKAYEDEMKSKIGEILERNGIMVEGDLTIDDEQLLTFWQHGVKPKLNESGNMVDTVIINGKPKYYEVQDPLLQDMLLSMNPESYGMFMNTMFGIKNFFTRSITLGVEFTGANLVRDTLGAAVISKNQFKPFVDSFRGMYSFIKKDELYQEFIRSGGGHSGRLEGATREGQARRRVKIDEFGVMTATERLLSSIDNIASAFEYGTRIGEFRLAKKNQESSMDAGFQAREISTDFSVLGANHFLTGFIRTVPFLNAMIQSQDRIFRGAVIRKKYDGNPTSIAMKAFLGITLPTLALFMINRDDEDYLAIPDFERRTNWHIKIPGTSRFLKIPRPYDVGFLYGTMPELFMKYVEDDKGRDFADGLMWTMTQMYGIDATPAVMTGWWDLVRNEKWTGAPVVPSSLSDVEAPQQYTSNTSETFVRMGEALGISPIKAEHMFKSYTGYLGGYLMAGTDHMLWDEEKFGPKPERDISENIFLSRFVTNDVRHSTAAMGKFFELKDKSDKITSTFKQTVGIRRAIKDQAGTGKFKDDKFFGLSAKEKEVLFALNDSMNQLITVIYGKEGIKTAELKIKYDKNLSAEQKREQMDKLWMTRNNAFSKYYNQADQALQKAKREAEKEK